MLVATGLAAAARLLVLASVSYTPLAKQLDKKGRKLSDARPGTP